MPATPPWGRADRRKRLWLDLSFGPCKIRLCPLSGRPRHDLGSLPLVRMEPGPRALAQQRPWVMLRARNHGGAACGGRVSAPADRVPRIHTACEQVPAPQQVTLDLSSNRREGLGRCPHGTARVRALAGRAEAPGTTEGKRRGVGSPCLGERVLAAQPPKHQPEQRRQHEAAVRAHPLRRSRALGAADQGAGLPQSPEPLHRLPAPPPPPQLPASRTPRGASGCQSSGRHTTPPLRKQDRRSARTEGLSQGSRRGRERDKNISDYTVYACARQDFLYFVYDQ